MSDDTPPTLTDAKGSGGLRALDGFDYQVWDALVRLPAWLLNPAFEGFILEGLEDFEARFFTPYAPEQRVLDRFQAKSSTLSKGEIIAVFSSFQRYSQAFPETARMQVLVTPALPAVLQWISRDQRRVQQAKPFYRPFQAVLAASDARVQMDFGKEFGVDLGTFVVQNVDVQLRTFTETGAAQIAFSYALEEAFPQAEVPSGRVRRAFDALVTLAGKKKGTLITHTDVLRVLDTELGAGVVPVFPLLLHIRSDRDAPRENALEIDASLFAGGDTSFPGPDLWAAQLTGPLTLTARWAHAQGHRRVRLSGSYRLSTAFAVGAVFRAASGFALEIPAGKDIWNTDDHPSADRDARAWGVQQPSELVGNRLPVVIGVLREPLPQALQVLGLVDNEAVLHLYLDRAIVDSQDAQVAVAFIKQEVDRAVAQFRPGAIDLFFVGPASLAITLGHRWNALPITCCHEFLASRGTYTPTCQIV